jgi:hypothetical protein
VACRSLVQATVASRLDYANSLLHGITETQMKQLQRVQNSAGRLVTGARKREHITPILHWLPVHLRINFKILLQTFKSLNGLAPGYIDHLIVRHVPGRRLRSADQGLLSVPRTHTKRYGSQAFKQVAPGLWNTLPATIRELTDVGSFKRQLKTYFCKQYYFECALILLTTYVFNVLSISCLFLSFRKRPRAICYLE